MQPIAPIVADTSPNLFAAAKSANLNPMQVNQVEQMSYSIDQHKKLLAMDPNAARTAYSKLDPNVQNGLKFLFKDASYLQAAPTAGNEAWGAIKTVGKIVASPIIGIFKLAGNYNKIINTPYLVAREVAQGDGSVFNKKIWTKAWDGNNIYDEGAIKKATDFYGANDVEVAKGLLQGKTPGEILQAHGGVDAGILGSIQKAFNDPTKFRQTLDDVKFAQVSLGRDVVRTLDDKPSAGSTYMHHANGGDKFFSGVADAAYQILIDPLTWATGGGDKAAMLGERLANTLEEVSKTHGTAAGVEAVFTEPRVQTLWQDQLGPMIQKYARGTTDAGAPAKVTEAQQSETFRKISKQFPGMADRETIDLLAKNRVYDAKSAQKFFSNAENTHLLTSGRVDGVTFARNGVAVAKTHRNYAEGIMTYLDSVFNATTSKSLGKLSTTGRALEDVDAKGSKIYEAMIKTGENLDNVNGYNPALLDTIKEQVGEIGKLKQFGYSIGKQAARSPAGLEIYIGNGANKTANNFNLVARQLLPRDFADYMTTRFLGESSEGQVVMLRNLYAGIMMKFGMTGEVKGTELMDNILRTKFGGQAGFATMEETGVPEHFVNYMEKHSLKLVNNQLLLQTENAIQPYHTAHAIGALPYDQIAEYVTGMKSKRNLLNALLGSANSPLAKKIVDTWSMFTLLPRLGIRSAIDESMMFLMTAPGKDILNYATRRGHSMGHVATAFTGSDAAVGPVRKALGKVFPKVDPTDAISVARRQELIVQKAKQLGVPVEHLTELQRRESIIPELQKLYPMKVDSDSEEYFLQSLVHSPDMLNAMSQASVGASGLSGRIDQEIARSLVDPSSLTKVLDKLGLKQGRIERTMDTTRFTDAEVAAAHYSKIFKGFVANKVQLTDKRVFDPGRTFLAYGGLKTEEDFAKAMDKLCEDAGMSKTINGSWTVTDDAAAAAFKSLSARTVEMANRGLTDEELIRDQVGRILTDLYVTFHGGNKNFNEKLYQSIVDAKRDLQRELNAKPGNTKEATWSEAVARMGSNYDEFFKNTTGFRPVGKINTDIEFEKLMEPESVWRKYGNRGFEMMDQQITGIHRQGALAVTYVQVRKNWAGIERQWVKDHVAEELAAHPDKYVTQTAKDQLTDRIRSTGQKRFTELAMQHAADEMLKYADNPAVRSNFSYAVRTVGRYYRATEDFQRRVYRLKEVPLRVLYRMRLAHLGLSASGSVYNDQQGNEYVMVPMDNVLYKATDSTLRALTGKSGYAQPLFNNFTLKLNMINPSFQQDSGLPMLSGPVAGLSVIGVKNLLGYTNNPFAINAGNTVSQLALGNFSNQSTFKTLMPQSLQRVWDMLPINEQSRQEVTAAQQAIAYNAANGINLSPTATAQEKANYLKNVRISAHNVIFLRNLLGFISPATTTLTEDKGVPDYLKRVGVTGLTPEFYDILNGITKADKTGDVTDSYEQALVAFIGKNPGKLIYTVSRNSKATRVVIKNTQQLNSWATNNQGAIKQYGEVAYIFAPQAGSFNSSSINYLQAAGLEVPKSVEQYYNDVLVAEDKQKYYDIGTQEKAAILATPNVAERSMIIAQATAAREALKTANPLLAGALVGNGSNSIGNETKLLSNLTQMVNDPGANIDPATRTRMFSALQLMQGFISFATDPNTKNMPNFTQLKADRRAQVEGALKDLSLGDPNVAEANRAIFKTILSFYSRDTYVAFQKGF